MKLYMFRKEELSETRRV